MNKVMLVLSIALIISTFGACKNSTVTESSSESATSKVVAVTTTSGTETSYVSTKTEKVAETTPTVSETESQIETSSESVGEKKLNLDLLSDIGLTYEEIREKRGVQLWAFVESGGVIYGFEHGYGGYGWGFDDLDYGRELLSGESFPLPWSDENGYLINEKAPLPKNQIKCGFMWYVQAKDLFIGLDQPATTSEIEEIYSVEHFKPEDAEIYGYGTNFTYEDKFIWIIAEKEGIVTPDSYLWIKPISDTF